VFDLQKLLFDIEGERKADIHQNEWLEFAKTKVWNSPKRRAGIRQNEGLEFDKTKGWNSPKLGAEIRQQNKRNG
jgi:hypothetical protein